MNKIKLNLNKQSVVTLTTEEAYHVKGGGLGQKRSNRLKGACRYSRNIKHAVVSECGCVVGCA